MTLAREIEASPQLAAVTRADDTREAALAKVYWAALALGTAAAVPAILAARGLVYDGAYYLLSLALHGQFQLWEPARHAVQFLQQIFAFAAERLGCHDLWTLGILFSLATAGWPILITALCWFALPRGEKSWAAGPLITLVFAIPATSFIGIGEGIIASCLLWLAFLLAAFRMNNALGAVAAILAVGACTVAHESAVLCLVTIAVAAALQFRRTRGFCRAASAAAALLALAGAAWMLRWIVVPRSAVERGDFLQGLLGGFVGTGGAPNLPALASLIGAVAILVALLRPRFARGAAAAAVAALVCLAVVLWLAPAAAIAPSRYFAARSLPVASATVLMPVFLWLRHAGHKPASYATPPVLLIVLALALAQAAGQLAMTGAWNGYATALRTLVSTERGAVSHAAAMQALDPAGGRFRREMLEHWSVEPLSILFAPGGHVRAVVRPAPSQRWVPFELSRPANLPRGPGVDWSQFRAGP